MALNIVLVEPEIPHNTATIGRTCVLTKSVLHLIRPLGFSMSDSALRRAGLDYWHLVDVHIYDDYEDFRKKHPGGRFFCATTKAKKSYTEMEYRDGDYFVFGKESRGLPESILSEHAAHLIRIPMIKEMPRSLNLSNSANIILFEALRQIGFPNLV